MAIRYFFLALLGFALCAQLALAQVNTATISGTVHDSSGAVLPGANVVIQNQDTGISRTVTTNETGRYSAPALGLGNFQVSVQLPGFQSQVRSGITLTVGREAVVDFTLAVGTVTQAVEVTGEAPLVELTNGFADVVQPSGPEIGACGPGSFSFGTSVQPSPAGAAAAGTSTQPSLTASPRCPWRHRPCRWFDRGTGRCPCCIAALRYR